MSVDMMPVVPGSEAAAPPSRNAAGGAPEPVQGDGAFAEMVGRFVDQPHATPKPARPAPCGLRAGMDPSQFVAAGAPGPADGSEMPECPAAPPELGLVVAFLLAPVSPRPGEDQVAADFADAPSPATEVPSQVVEMLLVPADVNVAAPAVVPMSVTVPLPSTDGEGTSGEAAPAAAGSQVSAPAGAAGLQAATAAGAAGAGPIIGQAITPTHEAQATGVRAAPVATAAAPGVVPESDASAADGSPGELQVPEVPADEPSPAPPAGAEVQAAGEPLKGPVPRGPVGESKLATPRPDLPEQASPRAQAARPEEGPPVARGLDRAAPPDAVLAANALKGRDGTGPVPADGPEAAAATRAVEPALARAGVTEGQTPVARGLNRAAPPAAALAANALKGRDGTEPVPADGAEAAAPTSAVESALAQAGVAEGRTTAAEPRLPEQAARAAAPRGAVAQGVAPRERYATETEVSRASAEAMSTVASAIARVVAAAAPIRLETDVLSAKAPGAAFPQANTLPSGLPFSLDLLTTLRTSETSAPPGPSVLHRPADTPDVPTQIVRAAHLQWRDGVGEARLRLNPEHLGEVTISLRVEQGAVFATIRAESPAALLAIQARQQELQAALEAQGLHLDHFVASADPDERREQSRYRPPRHSPARPAPESDLDTPRFEVVV